jgi:hypothetical protein
VLKIVRYASVCVAAALLLCAVGMLSRAALTARAAPYPPRVAPDFGGDCRALTVAYDAELEVVSRCSSDDDCEADERGGNKLALDGCWRMVNRHVSRQYLDALSAQWVNAGCPSQFEYCRTATCREPAGPVCRAGRCVDRSPAGIPTDWVRYEIAAWFSFFAPADLELDRRRDRHGKLLAQDRRAPFAGAYRGKGFIIELDSPYWTDSMEVVQHGFVATDAGPAWRVDGHDRYHQWQLFGVLSDARPPFAHVSSACFASGPLVFSVRCYNADACLAARQIRDSVTFTSGTL